MDIRGKRVLVTGGAGFIGSHLIDRLVKEGPKTIVVVDNLSLGKESNLAQAIGEFPLLHLRVMDASIFAAMLDLVRLEKPDVVFSLATTPLPQSLVDPVWSSETIFRLSLVACELARILRFKLIHVSSSEVYGDGQYFPMDESHPFAGTTPYAAAKAAADLLVASYQRTFGIQAVVARPFNTYGPRQNWERYAAVIPRTMKRMLVDGSSPVIHGDGEQTRDFLHVLDVVEAIVKIATDDGLTGQVVNICSGEQISVNELMEMLFSLAGFGEKPQYTLARIGDVRAHRGDGSKLKSLGFMPRYSLEKGLEETVKWHQTLEGKSGSD